VPQSRTGIFHIEIPDFTVIPHKYADQSETRSHLMDAINSFVSQCKDQFKFDFLWGNQDKNRHMKVNK